MMPRGWDRHRYEARVYPRKELAIGRAMLMLVLSVLAIGLISRGVTGRDAIPPANPTSLPQSATPTTQLDAATLQRMTIREFAAEELPPHTIDVDIRPLGPAIQVRPGETVTLALGVVNDTVCESVWCRSPAALFIPMALATTWSITPADGAYIDPATGIMSIDPSTPIDSVFTARAAVKGRSYVIERPVHIVTS